MTKVPARWIVVAVLAAPVVPTEVAHAACDREVSILGAGARSEGTAPAPYLATTDLAFTVTSTACLSAGAVVYRATGPSAEPGSDYAPLSGTLAFVDGDGSDRILIVRVWPDATLEEHEVVRVCLYDPKGRVRLGIRVAAGAILNDDGPTPPTQVPLPEAVCSR